VYGNANGENVVSPRRASPTPEPGTTRSTAQIPAARNNHGDTTNKPPIPAAAHNPHARQPRGRTARTRQIASDTHRNSVDILLKMPAAISPANIPARRRFTPSWAMITKTSSAETAASIANE